jgi:hypothetical protein
MSFPTIVYRTPGAHYASTGTYAYQGIADDAALEQALSDGWFRTLPEAIADEHEDDSVPTRGELEIKAVELAIKFDGRTTDRRLAELIENALSEEE